MHEYIHTYIDAYIHTYIHSYIHTYIHIRMCSCMHKIHPHNQTFLTYIPVGPIGPGTPCRPGCPLTPFSPGRPLRPLAPSKPGGPCTWTQVSVCNMYSVYVPIPDVENIANTQPCDIYTCPNERVHARLVYASEYMLRYTHKTYICVCIHRQIA
jgi:hypothetical protein